MWLHGENRNTFSLLVTLLATLGPASLLVTLLATLGPAALPWTGQHSPPVASLCCKQSAIERSAASGSRTWHLVWDYYDSGVHVNVRVYECL
jgi:hypothetical protein